MKGHVFGQGRSLGGHHGEGKWCAGGMGRLSGRNMGMRGERAKVGGMPEKDEEMGEKEMEREIRTEEETQGRGRRSGDPRKT